MSIQEMWTNFKRFFENSETVLVILIVGVAVGSFFLGRMSGLAEMAQNSQVTSSPVPYIEAPPLTGSVSQGFTTEGAQVTPVEEVMQEGQLDTQNSAVSSPEAGYVASKSGTKYHLPWCSGAKRIKEENKIWFASKEEAEAAGYTPAANCKGI